MPGNARENKAFNMIFTGMGSLLCAVAIWIGANAAHLPAIEQKLDDYIKTTDQRLDHAGL